MLHLAWKASLPGVDGELVPEPFEGELQAALVLGIEPPGPGVPAADAGVPNPPIQARVEQYGTKEELGWLVAVALANAHQQGYLEHAMMHLAAIEPGVAAYVIKSQLPKP